MDVSNVTVFILYYYFFCWYGVFGWYFITDFKEVDLQKIYLSFLFLSLSSKNVHGIQF